MSRGVLLTCSLPSKVSSHLRAVSHFLKNRISKLALRRSQLLQWISYRMVWFSTSLLGATRGRLQRMPWVSTSPLGTMRHHSQGKTSTLTCQMYQQCMMSPLRDARLVEDAVSGASVHSLQQANANVLPALCAEYDSLMAKRVYNSGVTVKPIITTYMHIVSLEVSVMIMDCSHNKPQIRMQLMQSPANGTPPPEQQRTQKFYSLLLRM